MQYDVAALARRARIGGDEFGVLSELESGQGLSETALIGRIERALAPPVTLDAVHLPVTTSVGWVLAEPGESIREVLGRADAAMYRRKSRARARAAAEHARSGEIAAVSGAGSAAPRRG